MINKEELRSLAAASTKVNQWHAHGDTGHYPATVRGPFNRWLSSTLADPVDDCKFAAAAAMNGWACAQF